MYERNILDRILDRDNLNAAYEQVRRNKGVAGIDGMTTDEIGVYLLRNKEEMITEIRQRKYQPSPVLRVEAMASALTDKRKWRLLKHLNFSMKDMIGL
jgi:retron-type reverse transcriptase